jgi:hypothetical protein
MTQNPCRFRIIVDMNSCSGYRSWFLLSPQLWLGPKFDEGQKETETRTHHPSPDVSSHLFPSLLDSESFIP